MSSPFDAAFARLDHAATKHTEFAQAWSGYIDTHPWEAILKEGDGQNFEMVVRVFEAAPASMSLAFSDWLSHLRAALDNGLYAWAVTLSGQDPPRDAGKLQFPIAKTKEDFEAQCRRLRSLPSEIIEKLEKAQPYNSSFGHESNLLFWLHELARTDRHRNLHLGLGRISEHKVQVRLPQGITATFDPTVQPYEFIDGELLIARFTTSRPLRAYDIAFNPGVSIDPEIKEWASFRLDERRVSLHERMTMTSFFMRNHIENMAFFAGERPPGGFQTIDPDEPEPDYPD